MTMIMINFIFIASISLTVLGTLQYHMLHCNANEKNNREKGFSTQSETPYEVTELCHSKGLGSDTL